MSDTELLPLTQVTVYVVLTPRAPVESDPDVVVVPIIVSLEGRGEISRLHEVAFVDVQLTIALDDFEDSIVVLAVTFTVGMSGRPNETSWVEATGVLLKRKRIAFT